MHLRQLFLLFLLSCAFGVRAQIVHDTLTLNLRDAEAYFIKNNISLLAQRYNIDATKAMEIQAKLYPNPNLSVASTVYNPDVKEFFPAPFTSDGEFQANLSQEIVLAGKLNKAFKLAQANTKLSEYQFYDLLRTLKYNLRSNFFNIYYLQQSAKVYQEEISDLQTVVDAYNQQEGKGYIAEKEVVRIKAQLYSLESEYQTLVDQINDTESELKLLLQTKANVYVSPSVDTNLVAVDDPLKYPLATLVDSANNGRTDLSIARTNTDISRLNYNYQKALAVPDLSAVGAYDQQGSYIHNLSTIGLAMDLPFFNRNQGNIRSAKATISMNEATQKSTELTVEEDVYRAFQRAVDADKLYKKIDPSFGGDFDRLMQAAVENYKKRNMGLLDFLDFYDAYKQNTLQINTIKYNKLNALEQLNFVTGSSLFNQ